MKRLSELAKWFFYITTCVLFVCAANVQISEGTTIPANMLWQIMLSGFVTALVTLFLRPGEQDSGKIGILKIVVHYFALCGIMIVCGCWFGWMNLNLQGIVMMIVSVAVVYVLVYFAAYCIDKKQADEINMKLRRKYGNEAADE